MLEQVRYELRLFDQKCKIANQFFNQIDLVWKEKGEKKLVSEQMKFKLFKEKKFQNFPFVFYFDNEPKGIVWVELTTPFYGSASLFVPDSKYAFYVMRALNDKGFFKNKIIELVGLDSLHKYKQAGFSLGLCPNIRKRMYLWLSHCDYFEIEPNPFQLRPYTKSDIDWSSDLSVRSHNISKDYEYYAEMMYPEYRRKLEDRVLNGLYGEIISKASFVLEYQSKPVAYCLVVEVKCWGYEKVPWVFDICVDPSFHGQGMGNVLTKNMLNNLIDSGYELMGLAVTLTNKYAIKMYEKYGFQDLDVFYEFVDCDLK